MNNDTIGRSVYRKLCREGGKVLSDFTRGLGRFLLLSYVHRIDFVL